MTLHGVGFIGLTLALVLGGALLLGPYLARVLAGEIGFLAPAERFMYRLCGIDPALLEQVLVNLLENAMKYGRGGGAVSIRAWRTDDHVAIDVADGGVGISANDLPHVFDSFYRAGRGDRVAPGTGLGLAIARAFIEAMGGTIRAESPRPDLPADGLPGTIMHIELPIA